MAWQSRAFTRKPSRQHITSPTVKAAGGVYLVRGTTIERLEGPAPKRVLITKWENIDKLTAWRESEAYMRTLPILDKAVKSVRSYAVEGVD